MFDAAKVESFPNIHKGFSLFIWIFSLILVILHPKYNRLYNNGRKEIQKNDGDVGTALC